MEPPQKRTSVERVMTEEEKKRLEEARAKVQALQGPSLWDRFWAWFRGDR
jgi:hypothetical protein